MYYDGLFTPVGCFLLIVTIVAYVNWALHAPLGSMSLPCITLLTSLIYFQILPAATLAGGDPGYFGIYMSDMTWAHFAVLLYLSGAMLAFANNRQVVFAAPIEPRINGGVNNDTFFLMWAIGLGTQVFQFALGKLNLLYEDNFNLDVNNIAQYAFLTLGNNLIVVLILVLLARERFSWRSIAALAAVLALFLQVGFRTPIIYVLGGGSSIWLAQRGIRPRLVFGVVGSLVVAALAFGLGAIRHYGQGIDLSGLSEDNISAGASRGGGELGLAYVLDDVTRNPLPELNWHEPWSVGFFRLVPSFLWKDKPQVVTLKHMWDRMTPDAEIAGVAGPQHVEFIYQFGWIGILPLAFLYFSLACWTIGKINARGGECRLVWATLAPIWFGFHMQGRGYFFQAFCECVVIVGTLYIVSADPKRARRSSNWGRQDNVTNAERG